MRSIVASVGAGQQVRRKVLIIAAGPEAARSFLSSRKEVKSLAPIRQVDCGGENAGSSPTWSGSRVDQQELPSRLSRRSLCVVWRMILTSGPYCLGPGLRVTSTRACRSKVGRSERRLASRIREEGGVTRRRSPMLVRAPLFISEGVVYQHPSPRGALEPSSYPGPSILGP